jgi:hypothetical protein
MAYRGDTTDPLQNIINGQQASRKVILLLVVLWVAPSILRFGWFAFTRAFPQPAANAAPTSTAVPIGTGVPSRAAVPATRKMSAGALEQLLRRAPASQRPPQNVRCLPAPNGWDYVCVYHTDVPQPGTQLKIGVRVSAIGIVQASAPQPLGTSLVSPQPVAR